MTASFDMTESCAPRSDQLNAEDLLTGPRTFTVEKVTKGSVEQPVDIHLVEFPGRPFKPSKTVRRLLVAAWGKEASEYVGRRLTLYRDPAVKFGGMDVGGIRVSHMSHIEKRITVALTVTRGKRAPFVVEPLKETTPPPPAPSGDANRHRQLHQLDALFTDAGLPRERRDDRILVAGKTAARPDLAAATDLTDDELGHVVDELAGWQRLGKLADNVGDILDQAAIDAAMDAENGEGK